LDAAGEDVSLRSYFAAAALPIAADALLGSLSAIWAAQARGEEAVQRCVDLPTQAYLAVEDRGAKIRRDLWEKSMPLRESNMLSQDILDGAK
jgi:hypothetical protein